LVAAVAAPARADDSAPVVIPAVGRIVHYRVTRLAQGNAGPRLLSSQVTLRRKSATTLTLRGIAGEPGSEQTVLTVQPDGMLQIPPTDPTAASNGALIDVVNGLNRVVEIFAGEPSIPRDGWSPILHLPDLRGANASVAVPVAAVNAGPGGFDLHGVGQFTVEAPASQSPANPASSAQRTFNRRRGFRGGPAFPGPGTIDPVAEGGAPAGATHPPLTVAVAVDGSVRRAAIRKISILETRSVTVDDVPYVNVSGWTIEASK
jgi:hypothetical protein